MYEKCLGRQLAQSLPQLWEDTDGPRWPLPDASETGLGIADEPFVLRHDSAEEALEPRV